MKQLIFSVILALSLFQTAQAMEVTFNFNVYSSGADIYPCNAGLSSSPLVTAASCHLVNSTNPCASGSAGCVCSSVSANTASQDYLTASLTNWDLSGAPTAVQQQGVAGGMIPLVADGSDFAHRLTNLSFNLGSEAYGDTYFVDICYRGPQVDYWQNDVGVNMVLNATTTVSDLAGVAGSASNYINLASLAVGSTVACDLQGMGANTTAAGVGGYNSLSMDLVGGVNLSGADVSYSNALGVGVGTGITSVFPGLALSQTVPSPTGANVQFNGVPRYCKVRYAFQEQSGAPRAWQVHGATVQTFTQIQAQ